MRRILAALFAVLMGVVMVPMSFLSVFQDTEFSLNNSAYTLTESGENAYEIGGKAKAFNYFGVQYTCDGYVKGVFSYLTADGKEVGEEFFLEPGENAVFYSFTDGYLEKKKGVRPLSLRFTPLSGDCGDFALTAFSVFNRKVLDKEIFIQNQKLKAGVNLDWGGALSYLEDLDSAVEVAQKDGRIILDSHAGEKSGGKVLSRSVNLINCHDTGRLVQQSYYGAFDGEGYEPGYFMESRWSYNPVQGGNQFNGKSKIVDVRLAETQLYIKARPMDWALDDAHITPSYMEATYTLDGGVLKTECRFVDFSGYPNRVSSQELPAFYCAEPLNDFIYPDENGELVSVPDLIFWPDAGYPNFKTSENWSAFTAGGTDGFGIGLLTPHHDTFLAGVFGRGGCSTADPAAEGPTSYIACVDTFEFMSFRPFEYEFYLTTGDANEIRSNFGKIK